ncbi:MAG: hypothetical protein OHK0017_11530 [Patescibacteria group bacterium]
MATKSSPKKNNKVTRSTVKNKPEEPELRRPPSVFETSQAALKEISEIMDCPVLSYYKPSGTSIWTKDLYAIWEALKHIGKVDKLAIYVRSDGGSGMISLRIINLLRFFAKKLIILAPSECASAATMLALGCDEIYLGPLSSLSAVDSSLTHPLSPVDKQDMPVSVSQDELWRVLRLWREYHDGQDMPDHNGLSLQDEVENPLLGFSKKGKSDKKTLPNLEKNEPGVVENPYKYLYQYVHPLVFGAIDRSKSLSIQLCKEILQYHMKDAKKIEQISHKLNYDYPAHGYPITMREAEEIGLNIKQISVEVQDILNKLQLDYGAMTDEMITDYDNASYHNHSIYSVVETVGVQVFYQYDFDKFYREIDKRYITLNDKSGWFKTSKTETEEAVKSKGGKSKMVKSEQLRTERIYF